MTSIADRAAPAATPFARLCEVAPGVILAAALAGAGFALRLIPGASAISPHGFKERYPGVELRLTFGNSAMVVAATRERSTAR
jgi:hypothetical protein